ncbi:Retrovirus-related Pol polyprotein from transposon RE2 [Cardamine amara subsp. amara]|uniref:Retrovirus-related Pol polyprotein from transposon RE2 n=1 Tax=Cardamine amara subsp. amara TaxID=228776 RepID=A0ABD0Z7I7_CARAN
MTLRNFVALVERQFDKKIKIIRSDNEAEFLSVGDYLREKGILHETSCVSTPQQNGRVERKHRYILNVASAFRFQSHLPVEFWGFCILTAGYLINRTLTAVLNDKTPFKMLYNMFPPMNHLHVFGCLCNVHNQKHKGDKFATRSNHSIFIGFLYGKKGWKIYDLETGVISSSQDVMFLEYTTPTVSVSSPTPIPPVSVFDNTVSLALEPTQDSHSLVHESSLIQHLSKEDSCENVETSTPPNLVNSSSPGEHVIESTSDTTSSSTKEDVLSEPDEVDDEDIPMGKDCRKKFSSTKLHGYATSTTHYGNDSDFVDSSWYPISDYVDCSKFLDSHCAFLAAITAGVIPRTYAEAFENEHWRETVRGEIMALEIKALGR